MKEIGVGLINYIRVRQCSNTSEECSSCFYAMICETAQKSCQLNVFTILNTQILPFKTLFHEITCFNAAVGDANGGATYGLNGFSTITDTRRV